MLSTPQREGELGSFVRTFVHAALAWGVLSHFTLAHAAEIRLKPTTPWHVEWEPNSCRVSRGFGDKDKPSALVIERFGPIQSFQLLLIGSELRGIDVSRKASIDFGNGASRLLEHPLTGTAKDKRPTLFVPSISLIPKPVDSIAPVPLAAEKAATRITASWRGKSVVYETGPLDKVFAEVTKCTDDMFRVWKLDKAEQFALTSGAEPLASPGTWLRSSDYPMLPLVDGEQGLIVFSLRVSADGVPTDCTIARSYGDEGFKKLTCQLLMKRARFKPAISATGQPVASAYVNTVSWVIR